MTTELRSLSAEALTRLGGLKTQCSAALLCTEHNAPHPCDACDALGLPSVACSACLQEFPDGRVIPGERPCASQAVFAKTSRIAFESEAMAALAAKARDKEGARERKKREMEEAERAPKPTPKPTPKAPAPKAPAPERPKVEVPAPAPSPPPVPKPAPSPAPANRRARLSVWASLGSAMAGAYILWVAPLVDLPSASTGILAAYGAVVLLVWLAGVETLTGKDPSHATLRWWAPLAWVFMCFAWPGVAGLAVAWLIGVSGLGFFPYALAILLTLGLMVAAVSCMAYGGVAVTLRPPWPKGLLDKDFKTLGSGWVWIALVATTVLNLMTWDGSGRLLERGPERAPAVNPRKPLIEVVANKPSPDKDLRGFSRATLADIAEAVITNPPKRGAPALPRVDASLAALARLPRPAVVQRASAQALATQAAQMQARNAAWTEVAAVLTKAHAADPQDAQILNDLAYAQLQTGQHAQALANTLESLRLAPASTNGWTRLAQVRLAASNGDPRQVEEAAGYYVVAYWFARDRQRMMRFLQGKRTLGPGDFPDNPAAVSLALKRLSG